MFKSCQLFASTPFSWLSEFSIFTFLKLRQTQIDCAAYADKRKQKIKTVISETSRSVEFKFPARVMVDQAQG